MARHDAHVAHLPGDAVAKDLQWWAVVLARTLLRRSFAHDDDYDDIYVACDPSTSFGIGVVVDGAELILPILPGWDTRGRDIAWQEAVALEIAVEILVAQGLSDCRVRTRMDNTSVFFSEHNGHSRNPTIMETLARIRDLEALNNLDVVPILVPNAHNSADEPSRGVRSSSAQLPFPRLYPAIRSHFG
ncbi:hypothetical protein CF327_g7341 [Tilletia walkeri]|nr:hypothetical protein CF327_g7341 [Tilletia walkeri]